LIEYARSNRAQSHLGHKIQSKNIIAVYAETDNIKKIARQDKGAKRLNQDGLKSPTHTLLHTQRSS
jgi:hypothetical protein